MGSKTFQSPTARFTAGHVRKHRWHRSNIQWGKVNRMAAQAHVFLPSEQAIPWRGEILVGMMDQTVLMPR